MGRIGFALLLFMLVRVNAAYAGGPGCPQPLPLPDGVGGTEPTTPSAETLQLSHTSLYDVNPNDFVVTRIGYITLDLRSFDGLKTGGDGVIQIDLGDGLIYRNSVVGGGGGWVELPVAGQRVTFRTNQAILGSVVIRVYVKVANDAPPDASVQARLYVQRTLDGPQLFASAKHPIRIVQFGEVVNPGRFQAKMNDAFQVVGRSSGGWLSGWYLPADGLPNGVFGLDTDISRNFAFELNATSLVLPPLTSETLLAPNTRIALSPTPVLITPSCGLLSDEPCQLVPGEHVEFVWQRLRPDDTTDAVQVPVELLQSRLTRSSRVFVSDQGDDEAVEVSFSDFRLLFGFAQPVAMHLDLHGTFDRPVVVLSPPQLQAEAIPH